MKVLLPRRHGPACLLAAAALLLPGCGWDGHFSILGYSTRPLYDLSIHTVWVPIFQNRTFTRGLEFELTKAVIREIESKTPYRVTSCREQADTELVGTIVGRNKVLINYNQLGEVREGQITVTVELYWRDLRPGHTGEILSKPGATAPAALTTGAPLVVKEGDPVPPVTVQSLAGFIPEIGQSVTTAQKDNVDRLAIQIVSMMEKSW
jgi:Lipopolysaccharide-assembly